MHDRPSAAEIALAVKEHLEREVIPALRDPKLRFQTLVAANVLGILEREVRAGDAALREELAGLRAISGAPAEPEPSTKESLEREVLERTRALCVATRRGEGDRARVFAHVRKTVLAKLAVANPAYKSLRKVATPSG